MYRIFCESYKNYMKDFNEINYRYEIIKPFELVVDLNQYIKEEKITSVKYKKLKDFLYFAKKSINQYPRFEAFLWTLESRNIVGEYFGVLNKEDLEEQAKIINMFLKLAYWN